MTSLRLLITDLASSRRGLAKVGTVILGLGVFLAAGVSPFTGSPAESLDRIAQIDILFTLRAHPNSQPVPAEFMEAFDPDLHTVFTRPESAWRPGVERQVAQDPPPVGASYALGLWVAEKGDVDRGLSLIHQENEHHADERVRYRELTLAFQHGKTSYIDALREDSGYRSLIREAFDLRIELKQENWWQVAVTFLRTQYSRLNSATLTLALLAGTLWAVLILSLLPGRLRQAGFFLPVAAIALGWISTWPTVLTSMWMDATFNLSEGSDFFSTLLYQLVSVGLREEGLKLLCFTPLLLVFRRRDQDVTVLIFGALVGLGFAIEENIGYLDRYQPGGIAVSRFVSANVLHFTLTGCTSLSLWRAVKDPARWGVDSVQVFAMAIGLHALYNSLLTHPVPGFGDMSYFSGTVLVGCSYLFFRELRGLAPLTGRSISRTAIFVWGFCALIGLELIHAVLAYSLDDALIITGQSALAAIFTGYIFIHFIDEPIGG